MFQRHLLRNATRVATVAFATALGITMTVQAQDVDVVEHVSRAGEMHEHIPQPNTGKISISTGFDITNAYYFRGIFQENQGFIVQPWLDATVNLKENLDLTFGIWNSFHDAQTGATSNRSGPDSWYEADLYIGLTMAVAENYSLGVTYTAYTSPNDAFGTIHEFALNMSHDDSAAWADVLPGGLQPSITLAFEVDGSALGPDEGIYLELAIEPSFVLMTSEGSPITLSIPVTVGLSLTDYYGAPNGSNPSKNDPNFGFLDVGAVLTIPLSDIPTDYGTWEATVGVHWLLLSENTELANNGDDNEIIATFGISMGY